MLKTMPGGLRLRSADVEHPHASGTFGRKSRADEGRNWVNTYSMARQPGSVRVHPIQRLGRGPADLANSTASDVCLRSFVREAAAAPDEFT